jgi:hypothetical protein
MVGGLLDVGVLDLGFGADLRFSLEYVRGDGTRRWEPLAACAAERFEEAAPVRSFHSWGFRSLSLVLTWAFMPELRAPSASGGGCPAIMT